MCSTHRMGFLVIQNRRCSSSFPSLSALSGRCDTTCLVGFVGSVKGVEDVVFTPDRAVAAKGFADGRVRVGGKHGQHGKRSSCG